MIVRPIIENVTVDDESGPNSCVCNYGLILDLSLQCVEYSVALTFHQIGAKFCKGGRVYNISQNLQETQAKKAGLDFDGKKMRRR